jgi:hypothetical protein
VERRSAAQKGAHQEFGLIVFLALAATLSFIWLAIRGPALLERISSWRPMCSFFSCETQAQLHREALAETETSAQAQPQPQALLQRQAQPQPQAQHQSQPQPRPLRPLLLPRPHMPDRVTVGECPPLRYWAQYSPRLREPKQRSPIECWRDRSIRGPCFD